MKPFVLTVYRILAYVTAVLLLVLCAGVVMRYAHVLVPVAWPLGSSTQQLGVTLTIDVGIMHGNLYILYLLVALIGTTQLRVPMGRMLLVLLAGTIPFGAFFAERKVTRWQQLRRDSLPLPWEELVEETPAVAEEQSATS